MVDVTDEVIKDAQDRFAVSQEGSEANREDYYADWKFSRLNDQWPDAVKKQRRQEGRPVLVINKLPALIRAVVNESRQNKPSMKVSPVDNGADEETAQVIGGLLRSIERVTNADVAYDTAIDHSVTGGFGFFRLSIDWANEDSFSLQAKIDRIPNPLMVHWDTSSTAFDASDWEYAFVSEFMNKKEYKKIYPKGSMIAFDGDTRDDSAEQWINDDHIRIAEYWLKEEKKRKLLQIAVMNPQTGQMETQAVREDQLPIMAKKFFEDGGIDMTVQGGSDEELVNAFISASGIEVRQERESMYHDVTRRIINGVEVLEEDNWPGSMIPICPVWGDEIFVDGKRTFKSMIRDAKDSQMMFNFWRSASTELVALAPKSPWVGPKGFIPKGQEAKWASANTRSHSHLEYDPAAGGVPQRQSFAGVPAGALQEAMNSNDDMKAITGIFDSSLGARSNETSGRAILARERQGDVSNFHFLDNLNRAIQYAGNCLLEIIPSVYSPQETIRILGEDRAEEVINLTQQAGGAYQKGLNGEKALYNLSVGRYDVTVSSGPSFATQREETRETLIEIMKQVPNAAAFLGDSLLEHMDFVGSDKLAKRLKHLLPPEMRQEEEADQEGQNPEVMAMQQQIEQAKVQMQEQQQVIAQEMQKLQAENEALKNQSLTDVQKMELEKAKAIHEREVDAKNAEQKDRELDLKEMELNLKAAQAQSDFDLEEIKMTTDRKNRLDDLASKGLRNADDVEEDRRIASEAVETAKQAQDTQMALLAQALTAPKRIVRDENGQPVGMETVIEEAN